MRRSTGAIFRETRPETIITSACRGLARKTSEPKRARSLREEVAFIISMAQQASPKVAGHSDDFRAQFIKESSRVVSTSGKASAIMFSSPIKLPLGRCSSLSLSLPSFQIREGPCLGFSFATSSVTPIEGALFNDVDIPDKQ